MLTLIERQLKLLKEAASDSNKAPLKYRKIAEREVKEIKIELDKINAMYSKIKIYEKEVCIKFDIEIPL